MINRVSQEQVISIDDLQDVPLFEFPFAKPEPGESARTIAIFRAVSYFRRAVAAGRASLDFYTTDVADLLERTENDTLRAVDRVVFATLQNARKPADERMDFLARYYLPRPATNDLTSTCEAAVDFSDLEFTANDISPRFSFAVGTDGQFRSIEQQDDDRSEAKARAFTILESWDLAEERPLESDQSRVVLAALGHMAGNAKNGYDRLEAATILDSMLVVNPAQLAEAMTR